MRVLVTGSAGFVDSHLVDRLLREGHEVVAVDSYLSGQRRHTAALVDHPSFSFIEADVSYGIPYDGERLDWVLHFASPASTPHYSSSRSRRCGSARAAPRWGSSWRGAMAPASSLPPPMRATATARCIRSQRTTGVT
jgi:hypothetical protein